MILPMTELGGLRAVLGPTKRPSSELTGTLDTAGIANQDAAPRQAVGQGFHGVVEGAGW